MMGNKSLKGKKSFENIQLYDFKSRSKKSHFKRRLSFGIGPVNSPTSNPIEFSCKQGKLINKEIYPHSNATNNRV